MAVTRMLRESRLTFGSNAIAFKYTTETTQADNVIIYYTMIIYERT